MVTVEKNNREYVFDIPAHEKYRVDEIFDGEYLPISEKWDKCLNGKDSAIHVVDIGANVGVFSVWAQAHFSTWSITAYEPSHLSFMRLLYNLHRNCPMWNVVKEVALTQFAKHSKSSNISTRLYHPNSNTGLYTLLPSRCHGDGKPFERVKCVSPDGEIRDQLEYTGVIDFLKIDTEGSEIDILEALYKDQLLRHIRHIQWEQHDGLKKPSFMDYAVENAECIEKTPMRNNNTQLFHWYNYETKKMPTKYDQLKQEEADDCFQM
jgi:FkbM family methyltransferase